MRKIFDFSNPVLNLKNSVKKDSLITDLSAVLTPITYVLIPSVLKLSGWTALAVGGLGTWLIGAMFKIDGMKAGAIGAMAVHVVYAKFSGELAEWKMPVWRLGKASADLDTKKEGAGSLARLGRLGRLGSLRGYTTQPETNNLQLGNAGVLSRPVGVGRLGNYSGAEMGGTGIAKRHSPNPFVGANN